MGKGGAPQPTDQTVVQSNLPKYVRPYFERLLERTEGESKREYEPYMGTRIADESADVLSSRDMVRNIAGSGLAGFDEAMMASRAARDRAAQSAGFNPFQFQGTAQEYQFDPFQAEAGKFDTATAQDYMSPFMQQVVDVQKERAILDAQRQGAGRAAQAVQAGAFGGSRQAVQEALAGEALSRQLGEIQASGQQQAFEQAQQQFERDRAARMADRTARMGLDTQRAAEAARVQKQRLGEQELTAAERRAAEQLGLGAAELQAGLGMNLAQLGERARAGDVQAAQMLEQIGKDQTARKQAGLDIAYEDFVRQRDYPREQLQFMSSILRGVPVQPSTETTKLQSYNPVQQLLGTGISALGLYKGIQGV